MTVSSPIPLEARTSLRIPLVSANVQAGFPSSADDHLERSIDLSEHLVKDPAATLFVRVKGDSMRDAGASQTTMQSGFFFIHARDSARFHESGGKGV